MSPKRVRDTHGEGHSGPHWVCGCCRQVHNSTARPEPGRAARLEVGGPQVFLGAISLFAGCWPGGEAGRAGHLGDWGQKAASRGPSSAQTRLEPSTEHPVLQTHGGAWNREPARPQ